MTTVPILTLDHVSKRFQTPTGDISILNSVSLSVMPGEKVAIIGPSGSGKSTLLSLIGLLDMPTEGNVLIAGKNIKNMGEREQALFRNEKIGLVFQSFELISPFTVRENIEAPLEIGGKRVLSEDVTQILDEVGLTERADAPPHTLSGGEKQRVAIARALIHKPDILLADEPTGSLDRATGERVLQMLFDAVTERGTTLVMITHDESIAAKMDRVFEIKNGGLYAWH